MNVLLLPLSVFKIFDILPKSHSGPHGPQIKDEKATPPKNKIPVDLQLQFEANSYRAIRDYCETHKNLMDTGQLRCELMLGSQFRMFNGLVNHMSEAQLSKLRAAQK